MEYDLEGLSKELGFDVREVEKVLRSSDILEDVSHVEFLRNRLSLYGGTALNLIHLKEVPRLSVDLDFNYRHINGEDWGDVRDKVEERIKEILYTREYEKKNVKINPTYPLVRIDVSYRNSLGIEDSFIIEIGYMRRIPILKKEQEMEFNHLGKREKFRVKTPQAEELFANKLATCLYRTTSRDVYDAYRISKVNFDSDVLRKCLVIDSLTRGSPHLNEIEVSERLDSVQLDSRLQNLLRLGVEVDFQRVIDRTSGFAEKIIDNLTEKERTLIREFYHAKKFRPDTIDNEGIFHEKLKNNPAILWAMKNI